MIGTTSINYEYSIIEIIVHDPYQTIHLDSTQQKVHLSLQNQFLDQRKTDSKSQISKPLKSAYR